MDSIWKDVYKRQGHDRPAIQPLNFKVKSARLCEDCVRSKNWVLSHEHFRPGVVILSVELFDAKVESNYEDRAVLRGPAGLELSLIHI